MKKGLDPWVREHRTSLPSQGRSLVSRIWPCVAHPVWILFSRGTKRPDTFLKNGKKGGSESTDSNTTPEARKPTPERIMHVPPGALRRAGDGAGGIRPKKGRHTSNDQEPSASVPEQSIQDPLNRGQHSGVFLTLQLQELEQGPEKPKKQHEAKCFQSNPEKTVH